MTFEEWYDKFAPECDEFCDSRMLRDAWLACAYECAKLVCSDCHRGHNPMLNDGFYYHNPELECPASNIHRHIAEMSK